MLARADSWRRLLITTEALFWSHVATLESGAKSASIARDFVRKRLNEHQLLRLVDDVGLVVSELAQLLIDQERHRPDFTVLLMGGGGEVLLQLQDGPPSFAHAVGRMTNGYDLQLTERLSERWGMVLAHAGGSVMWASFAANGSGDPKASAAQRL